MKMKDYIIYKVENKINGLVYIGATKDKLLSRIKDHKQKSIKLPNRKFYNALSTYKYDDFKWEQIDTASSLDELAKKEKEYILEYNSKDKGYNSDTGGGFQKTVYKYNLEGDFIDSFKSLSEASKTVNSKKQQISRACLDNKSYKGFY